MKTRRKAQSGVGGLIGRSESFGMMEVRIVASSPSIGTLEIVDKEVRRPIDLDGHGQVCPRGRLLALGCSGGRHERVNDDVEHIDVPLWHLCLAAPTQHLLDHHHHLQEQTVLKPGSPRLMVLN